MNGLQPLTTADLEQAIRTYLADEGRRPDVERMARYLKRSPVEVREVFGLLVSEWKARFEAGLMTLLDRGEALRPDTSAPAPVKITPRTPHTPVLTALKEATHNMPTGVKVTWPEDQALLLMEQVLRDEGFAGERLCREMLKRFDLPCSWTAVRNRLDDARRIAAGREPHHRGTQSHGQDVLRKVKAAPPAFICKTCKDSGKVDDIHCHCAVGRRAHAADQALQLGILSTAPAPAAPVAAESTGQGVGSPAPAEAANSVVAPQGGMLGDVPPDQRIEMTVATGVGIPLTLQEIAALTGREIAAAIAAPTVPLEGHEPTPDELQEMLAEPEPTVAPPPLVAFVLPPSTDQQTREFIQSLEKALADAEQTIDQLRTEVACLTATIDRATIDGELEAVYKVAQKRGEEIHQLNSKIADLCRALGRAEEKLSQPLYLEFTDNGLRSVTNLTGPIGVVQIGDQFVQPVTIDGHHLYSIYAVTMQGEADGRPVRVLVCIHRAGEALEKGEAA